MANVTLNVTDNNGKEAGTLEAPEALFGFTAEEVQAHVPLIHQAVVAQRAAARQARMRLRTVALSPVVAASRGSRRAPVALVRARSALLSGTTAVSHTARCRVTTASAPPRR